MDNLLCKTCNSPIHNEWRKDRQSRKKPLFFCSRNCANSRGPRSKEVKSKIANTLKSKPRKPKPLNLVENVCIACKNIFYTLKGKIRKTCSKVCENYLHSLHSQRRISKMGCFSTPRELFTYKSLSINVDSNLEKAGIIYLTDIIGAYDIERFNNIISFKEGDVHRTYNPDFICMLPTNQTAIIEIKQRWITTSTHCYNRTIPLKKQALEEYCNRKGYKMLWLDFDSAPQMKYIYKKVLSDRKQITLNS